MLFMIDETQVEAEDTQRFLEAFETVFLPPASKRGLELVACWHTPPDIGEDVTVTTIFQMRAWAHWDELRARMFLEPSLPEWLELLESLRKSGTRNFYTPTSFSPLK